MKILVGLGNPGSQYRFTRHNAGFLVLDRLAERLALPFGRERFGGLFAKGQCEGCDVVLLKPLTYMNRSGECVGQALRYTNAAPEDVLVVVDDVNLPLGRLRVRSDGSAGGHNGLKSIIEHLGSDAFPRLRIGVGQGRQGATLTGHVLGTFAQDEMPEMERAVDRAADAAVTFVVKGLGPAMNAFNAGKALLEDA